MNAESANVESANAESANVESANVESQRIPNQQMLKVSEKRRDLFLVFSLISVTEKYKNSYLVRSFADAYNIVILLLQTFIGIFK